MNKAVLNSLLLSFQQPQRLPQTLIFFVTSRCNARCEFCLYYEQITNPVAKKEELTVSEVEEIARRYGRLHYLALSGGEPFVRQDLALLCQAFIDHCGTSVIDIPSNFYYTETMLKTMEPLLSRNPEVVFDLQMSIDHIGALHDESRKVKNLYARAITSFRELSRLREANPNLKLKINVVYLDLNRAHLEEIVAQLSREVAYDRIQITYPTHMVPGEQGGETAASAADVRAFVDAERGALARSPAGGRDLYSLGMRSVKGIYHRLLAEAVGRGENVGSYCEAGRHIVVMNEKGDIFPCEPLWQKVGNVRQQGYDVGAVLAGEEYRRFRAERLGPGKCNCTWGCAIHSSISVRRRFLPGLAANALRILAEDCLPTQP